MKIYKYIGRRTKIINVNEGEVYFDYDKTNAYYDNSGNKFTGVLQSVGSLYFALNGKVIYGNSISNMNMNNLEEEFNKVLKKMIFQ